jgi:hypothetical protein
MNEVQYVLTEDAFMVCFSGRFLSTFLSGIRYEPYRPHLSVSVLINMITNPTLVSVYCTSQVSECSLLESSTTE